MRRFIALAIVCTFLFGTAVSVGAYSLTRLEFDYVVNLSDGNNESIAGMGYIQIGAIEVGTVYHSWDQLGGSNLQAVLINPQAGVYYGHVGTHGGSLNHYTLPTDPFNFWITNPAPDVYVPHFTSNAGGLIGQKTSAFEDDTYGESVTRIEHLRFYDNPGDDSQLIVEWDFHMNGWESNGAGGYDWFELETVNQFRVDLSVWFDDPEPFPDPVPDPVPEPTTMLLLGTGLLGLAGVRRRRK